MPYMISDESMKFLEKNVAVILSTAKRIENKSPLFRGFHSDNVSVDCQLEPSSFFDFKFYTVEICLHYDRRSKCYTIHCEHFIPSFLEPLHSHPWNEFDKGCYGEFQELSSAFKPFYEVIEEVFHSQLYRKVALENLSSRQLELF